MPGLTAWVGLYEIARILPGETIFVSAAAGAVGSIAGQLAKLAGLRVVGSAGTSSKVKALHDLGLDASFDYKDGDLVALLEQAAPEEVDCYFDNVGGSHLAAALACMNPYGRIAACGMIAGYHEPVNASHNLSLVISKKLTLRGFIVSDRLHRTAVFRRYLTPLARDGRLVFHETHREVIESALDAFFDVLRGGRHLGKMVVDLRLEG